KLERRAAHLARIPEAQIRVERRVDPVALDVDALDEAVLHRAAADISALEEHVERARAIREVQDRLEVGQLIRDAGRLLDAGLSRAVDLARAGERLRVLVEPRREQACLERFAVAAAPRDVAPPQHLEILAANSRLVDVEDDVADQDYALGDRIARHEAAQIHRAFLAAPHDGLVAELPDRVLDVDLIPVERDR